MTGFLISLCHAQQDAQYTQYMYNTISVNPAYAGSREMLNAVVLHRTQWLGIEGAPSTQTLAIDMPFGNYNQLGLGLSIVNEKIGPASETYFNIDLSHSLFVNEFGRLSFGLKGVAHLISIDYDKLDLSDLNDGEFASINNRFSPNVGFGMYYHTERFYIGFSIPNLLETKHFSREDIIGRERMNYYLINGYVFDLNDNIKFKPALLTKLVLGAPLQIDLSTNFMFYEKFTFGVAYRWSAAVSAIAGFQITNTLMAGVAYDRETTDLGNLNSNNGSYEFMLRYEPKRKSIRRVTPRFF